MEHGHLMAADDQRADDMRSDESGPADDKNFHSRSRLHVTVLRIESA
jgi:hypothetical protein